MSSTPSPTPTAEADAAGALAHRAAMAMLMGQLAELADQLVDKARGQEGEALAPEERARLLEASATINRWARIWRLLAMLAMFVAWLKGGGRRGARTRRAVFPRGASLPLAAEPDPDDPDAPSADWMAALWRDLSARRVGGVLAELRAEAAQAARRKRGDAEAAAITAASAREMRALLREAETLAAALPGPSARRTRAPRPDAAAPRRAAPARRAGVLEAADFRGLRRPAISHVLVVAIS